MKPLRDRSRLEHIASHAQEAVDFARACSRADLDSNRLLNLALVRLLEVVGEAASQVSTEGRLRYPELPWRHMIGLRNRLIHGYDEVNFDILWDLIQNDLPPLLVQLEQILNAAGDRG